MASIAYSSGINRFVSILPNNISGAYSDDNCTTWTAMNLGASRNWSKLFVVHSGQTPFFIATTSGSAASQSGTRSSDGINWTGFQMLPLVGGSNNCSWSSIASIDNHIIVLPYDMKSVSTSSYASAPYFYSYNYGATWNSGDSPKIPGYLGNTATNCITSVDESGQKYFVIQSQMISHPFYASGFKIDYNSNNPTGFSNHPKFSVSQYPTFSFPAFKYSNQNFIFSDISTSNSGYISSNTGINWSPFKLLTSIDTLEYSSGLWIGLRFKPSDQFDSVKDNFLLSGNDNVYPSYSNWRYDSLPLINTKNDYEEIILNNNNLYLISSSGYKKMARGTITKNYYIKSKYINTATINGDATNRSFGNRVYIENNTALIVGISGNTANFIPTGRYNISRKSGITWTDKVPLNITGTCRLYPNCAVLNENQNIIFIPSAINTGNGCRTSVSILTGNGQNWQHISNIYSITTAENVISSMVTNKNATRLAIGIPSANSNTGAVYLYSGNIGNWSLMTTLTGGNSSNINFGTSISFNDSGNTLAVGANSAFSPSGGVYIFTGQTDWSISNIITGTTNTNLGSFVGLNSSGNVLVSCGLYGGGTYRGNAEIFTGNNNSWGLSNVVKDSNYTLYNGTFGTFNSGGNLFFMGNGGSLTAPISLSEKYGDKWIHHTNFTGTSINVNGDGSRIIIGNLYKYDPVGGFPYGSVDIYEKDYEYGIYDVDAYDYISRVQIADQEDLEFAVQISINKFITGCKVDGIWDAIKSSCILAAAKTLSGALVPLKGTAPTNYNFISGDYNRVSGLKGDGFSKYLDSNRPSNAGIWNNKHISVYVTNTGEWSAARYRQNLIGAEYKSGVAFRFNNLRTQTLSNGSVTLDYFIDSAVNPANIISFGAPAGYNLIGANRFGFTGIDYIITSGNEIKTGVDYTVFSRGTGDANINMFVFRRNYNPSSYWGAESTGYTNARLSFYSMGDNLDLYKLNLRVSGLMSDLKQYLS